jgi:hypothetical protein
LYINSSSTTVDVDSNQSLDSAGLPI